MAIQDITRQYRLKLPLFEGPLDLLLHLVKVNEMDIYDIEIAKITGQFLAWTEAMVELDLEGIGDYLVMAATLMNLKSRSLLPALPDEQGMEEDELDEIASTEELIRRLVEYRKFKEFSAKLRQQGEDANRQFHRVNVVPLAPESSENKDDIPQQDVLLLFEAFSRVLQKIKQSPDHEVYTEKFTIDEKLVEIRRRLREEKQLNMTEIFRETQHKDEVICYFLALLELAKLREITLAQAGLFDDILIEPWDTKVIYVG